MAVLANNNRKALWAKLMSTLSSRREVHGTLTKADLRAVVDAVDSWIDVNSASFNSALPAKARTELTAKQKAELLMEVIKHRWEVA